MLESQLISNSLHLPQLIHYLVVFLNQMSIFIN